jgi:hypothetical protein
MSSTNSPASECGDKHKAKALLTREVYDFVANRREAATSTHCGPRYESKMFTLTSVW